MSADARPMSTRYSRAMSCAEGRMSPVGGRRSTTVLPEASRTIYVRFDWPSPTRSRSSGGSIPSTCSTTQRVTRVRSIPGTVARAAKLTSVHTRRPLFACLRPAKKALGKRLAAERQAPLGAAVDDERGAGREAGGAAREVERRADELVRLAAAAEREGLPLLGERVVVPAGRD